MKREQLDLFLTEIGYMSIPSNLPEYTLFFRPENQSINVISIIDCSRNAYMTDDQYEFVQGKIKELFANSGARDLHILSLIISDNWERMRTLYEKDRFCWMISPTRDQMVILETQTPDFYGLRSQLEHFLVSCRQGTYPDHAPISVENEKKKVDYRKLPWIAILLLVLNAVAFIFCAFTGDLLYNIGNENVLDVLYQKQYYRLVSSMFLHADLEHLFSNMILLFYIGKVVENKYGHLRFLILYILAGISGGVVSMVYEATTRNLYHSIGASGAVFGIMGALLVLVVVNRGKMKDMTVGRVAFMVLFSLYNGFKADHINNAAHVGGLVSGIVLAALLWLTIRKERKTNED